MDIKKDTLKSLYSDMYSMRRFEEEVEVYSKNGTIPGFVHLGIGQEAAQTGIVRALKNTDYKFPDHRGHGVACLCGTDKKLVMAEIFGKATGINGGRGGSMHIIDPDHRNMGNNAIQGSIVVTGLGTAFSSVYNGTDDVTAVFMGDGTLGEGACHESMNMAATWKLPVIYCLLNNHYAISTHFRESHPQYQLADWTKGYNVPSEVVDGNDVEAVIVATGRAAERARKGEGPTLLEFMTYRWQGHFAGDPAAYRPDEEVAEWKARCPLQKTRDKLLGELGCTEEEIRILEDEVDRDIAAAVQFARDSPWPDRKEALKHVYENYVVEDWN